MTTAITIDAHAGWDVTIRFETLNAHGDWEFRNEQRVPAFQKEIVYIHSHLRISEIREVPKTP